MLGAILQNYPKNAIRLFQDRHSWLEFRIRVIEGPSTSTALRGRVRVRRLGAEDRVIGPTVHAAPPPRRTRSGAEYAGEDKWPAATEAPKYKNQLPPAKVSWPGR